MPFARSNALNACAQVHDMIHPVPRASAAAGSQQGRKTLDLLALSGDPDANRQATWGMPDDLFSRSAP
jgi:hypothetical protein